MKKFTLLLLFVLFATLAKSQNCIDVVIIKIEMDDNLKADTIYCKILSENSESIVIDNGYAISTISKQWIIESKQCVREMDGLELYRFKGIDFVTKDYFKNTVTVGNYLRKAANNSYIAMGVGLIGSAGIVLGSTLFNDTSHKNVWLIGGTVGCAASVFFFALSWNNIYKAGKLLDINENSALYLTPGMYGQGGVALRFK